MASGKDQLVSNKELAAWWVSVSHDARFAQVLVLARAELSETAAGWEALKGATSALDMLKTFTDVDNSKNEFPSPGIDHNLTDGKPLTEEEKLALLDSLPI